MEEAFEEYVRNVTPYDGREAILGHDICQDFSKYTKSQKVDIVYYAKKANRSIFLQYNFFSSSVMYRVMTDILCTLVMAMIECRYAFYVEDFYEKSATDFILHEAYYYDAPGTVFITVLRIAF